MRQPSKSRSAPPAPSAVTEAAAFAGKPLDIAPETILRTLSELLEIPSPTGYTDRIVHVVADRLEAMGVPFEITRRGAIRANMKGAVSSPDRGIVSHVDTLGAQVNGL